MWIPCESKLIRFFSSPLLADVGPQAALMQHALEAKREAAIANANAFMKKSATGRETMLAGLTRVQVLLAFKSLHRYSCESLGAHFSKQAQEMMTVLNENKDYVKSEIRHDGRKLADASEEIRGDRDIAFAAITQNGNALGWCTPELRADPDFVLKAAAANPIAIKFTDVSLWKSKEFTLAAIEQKNIHFPPLRSPISGPHALQEVRSR